MFMSDYIMYFSVINCLIFIALCIIIIYCLFLVHCVFFVVIWIWIFGVLTPLSAIFQLYHGDQFTKPGANPRHIGDRLVWAVRSNDLTHWTTWDVFAWLHCVLLLYIVYSWLQVHCVFFVVIWIWIFGVLCHFQQYFSYIMVTNLQSGARTHAVLVIGLYKLLDPTT